MSHLSDDVGGDHEVVGEAGLDYVRPCRSRDGGGHLGVNGETGGGRHLVWAGTKQAGQHDVEPVHQGLLSRLHQGRQGPGPGLAAACHSVESFQWAAHQGQVPGEDAALGVDQPAGGQVRARLQQLGGGVQAGAEQLEATEEDGHDISSGQGNISTADNSQLFSSDKV